MNIKELKNVFVKATEFSHRNFINESVQLIGVSGVAVRLVDETLRIHMIITHGDNDINIIREILMCILGYAASGIIALDTELQLATDPLDDIFEEAVELAEMKSNDYGGTIDNIKLTGIGGIVVRLIDKAARIHSLTHGTEQKVKTESIQDTLIDVVNYAAFSILLIDNKWESKGKNNE